MSLRSQKKGVLPGFGLTMGVTITYLSLVVLIPLSALLLSVFTHQTWAEFWQAAASPRVLAAYRLSLTTSVIAATIDTIGGLLIAWVLVRYQFPGKKFFDAIVDLPFALPTAVAGIALTSLYASSGWLGRPLEHWGLKVAFTPIGIVIALAFIGLPFAVRTVETVLKDLDPEIEEASASLGAGRWKTFTAVIMPHLFPALLTGFTLAFARALGEYGSVVFISGNMPFKTEIAPLLIMTKLEQFDYAGAMAIAVVMLSLSFVMLFVTNRLQAWKARYLV